MRNVVLEAAITLDGYIARLDGSVDYLFMPKGFSLEPFFKSIDVVIMGRKTYEVGLKLGGFGMFKIPIFVMSRSMPEREEGNLVFTHQSPRELITALRKAKGKKIWLMGGGELTRSFLQEDLVDEISFGRSQAECAQRGWRCSKEENWREAEKES
jgi:dihydrofolate reductase